MSEIPYSVRGGRSTTSVDGLTDTNITNLQNQQILKYDSASQKWVNAVDGGGDATISSLGDTLISNPQTNQSLVYNATVSPARWENQPTPFTQSDFTNTVSTDAAFIKHKPIITTTSLATMVGISTGINKEGDLTAFGKGAGYAGKNGHICIGELSGNLGSTRAISLGYNTHATHVNSVVIHGGVGLSSSATNAFYIDPLRTLDALTENVGDMKINMYNTSTKEIFLTNNLLVPGKTKLNGSLEVSNGLGTVNQVLTSNATGALTWTDKSQLSANVYDLGGLTWSGVSDNELIRRVDATNADGTGMTITDVNDLTDNKKTVSFFNRVSPFNVPLGLIDYSFNISSTVYKTHISPKSSHAGTSNGLFLQASSTVNAVKVGINVSSPSQDFQVGNTLYVDNTNRKVGINKATPDEVLDINGKLRIEANGTQTIRFYDTQGGGSPDEDGRIEVTQDGGGGEMKFYTLETGNGTPQERLSINRRGALGLTTNYGSAGQFLKTNGSGSAVSWDTPIDTTYTNGTGVSISPSNVISIGQLVGTFDSPIFNTLTIGNGGANLGVINIRDTTNTGIQSVAQIRGILDGNNGGQLEFYTKVDGGAVTRKMTIQQNGSVKITTDGVGLSIASQDGVTEQGYIYNSGVGTKDFVIEAATGSLAKCISFRISGIDKLKIGNNGEIGIGGANYGNSGQFLKSNGTGSAVSWVDAPSGGSSPAIFANAIFGKNGVGPTYTVIDTWGSQVAVGITPGLTDVFTTPTPGWYQLSFSLDQRAAGTSNVFRYSYIYVLKNNVVIHEIVDNDPPTETEDARTKGGGFLVQMAAGDYIRFATNANSGNYNVAGKASFVKVDTTAPAAAPSLIASFMANSTSSTQFQFSSGTPLFSSLLNNTSGNRGSFNIGNAYNTSTGLFTAPESGVYSFYGSVFWQTSSFNANYVRVMITKPTLITHNNALIHSQYGANEAFNANYTQIASGVVSLIAGDTIGLYVFANNTTNASIQPLYSYFSGHRV